MACIFLVKLAFPSGSKYLQRLVTQNRQGHIIETLCNQFGLCKWAQDWDVTNQTHVAFSRLPCMAPRGFVAESPLSLLLELAANK